MNVFYQIKLKEKLVEEDVPYSIIDNRKTNWKKKITHNNILIGKLNGPTC